jgi:energy-coupling factor transporter ATP-binding protein EcfA2
MKNSNINAESENTDSNKPKLVSKVEQINDHFKLPIHYNLEKMELKKEIIDDLELIETTDPSGTPMLDFAFQPKSILGKKVMEQFSLNYTTDIEHLKDNQKLIKEYKGIEEEPFIPDYDNIISIWDEIKNDTGFKEKYRYIDWKMWEFLNKNENFLQLMCLYDLSSPVISLLSPMIIIIIPFFIIKFKGLQVNWNQYLDILKVVISNQPIGRLFTEFNNVKLDQKIYLLLSTAFYIFTIYQNLLSCMRFYKNMSTMHTHINDIKLYLKHTKNTMKNFLNYSRNLKTYNEFNDKIMENMNVIDEIEKELNKITPWKFSFSKINELGHIQKYFYELYSNKIYNDAIMYSFGFNGYIDNLNGVIQNIQDKKMNIVKFTSKNKKILFKNAYYPSLINKNPVKNTYKFKKNIIITGPNASGKTTILKTTLINIFISQQIGYGFYETATLKPYKYIHCYLNIPDTSGRDSLFQAEARRCKEIIDIIKSDTEKREHFCAFDELYSGTNPDEAVISAIAFMEYLIKNHNVNCILTTHFNKLCEHLDKNKNIINCHMKTKSDGNDFKYLYKLEKGISIIRGGIKVLTDMNYPKEILDSTKNYDKVQ